jgi:hypothetical protein
MSACWLAKVEWQFDGFADFSFTGPLVFLGIAALVVGIVMANDGVRPTARRSRRDSSAEIMKSSTNASTVRPVAARPVGPLTRSARRELRAALRRDGNPVDVIVARMDQHDSLRGRVLNRSRGGLLIAVAGDAKVGELYRVRALHAPDELDWTPIEIRHCSNKGPENLWGCKFTREVPWNELLLFG